MTGDIYGQTAEIAQLVERNLAKVEAAGSSPVFRSKTCLATDGFLGHIGDVPPDYLRSYVQARAP